MIEEAHMWHGSTTDIAVQQSIEADRKWIDLQPNVMAHGRAVSIFGAHERSPTELMSFVERFRRIFFFMNPNTVEPYRELMNARGCTVARSLTLRGGREHIERCVELAELIENKVPGARLLRIDEASSDECVSGVQELYSSVGVWSQSASFIRGYDGTAITLAAISEDGRVFATSSVQHLGRADPALNHVGYSCNTGVLPEYRISGLARLINATAVVEAVRCFKIEEMWANAGEDNEAAIAFHRSIGRQINPNIETFWAELAA